MTAPTWTPGEVLASAPWLSELVRDAMAGCARETATFLESEGMGPAPAWSSDWFEGWAARQREDRPPAEDPHLIEDHLAALSKGEADVVITGQQPGFLGGPLYTLLKVATCIAAAQARTRAGRLTVPLFWSGDADDDLPEALAVKVWDPRRDVILRPSTSPSAEGRMIGSLPADLFGRAELAWLSERRSEEAAELVSLWTDAVASGERWGRLHARALRQVFSGHGLLTVSGDDGEMLAVAAPLLDRALAMGDDLTETVRRAGAALVDQGHHAQIAETSLERPLHRAVDGTRHRVTSPADMAAIPARDVRPGVLLRSPVQDWLFRPAAVIVGPGERAYLDQLRPLYGALDLPRAPLLPRAHARFGIDGGPSEDLDLSLHVERAVDHAAVGLAGVLESLGSPEAHDRAGRIAGRWRGTVEKGLAEAVRALGSGSTPDSEAWMTLGPGRQERILPGLWAHALMPGLVPALSNLAGDHLERCAAGAPCDYVFSAPDLKETP